MLRVKKFPGHGDFSLKMKQLLPPSLSCLARFDNVKDARNFVNQKMNQSVILGSPSLPVDWSSGRNSSGPGNLLEISNRLKSCTGVWVKPELVPQNGDLTAIIDQPGNFFLAIDEGRTGFARWGPMVWGYQNHSLRRIPDYLVFPGPSGVGAYVASETHVGEVPESDGAWLPDDVNDLLTQSSFAGNFFLFQDY